jgi:hypothetical protein
VRHALDVFAAAVLMQPAAALAQIARSQNQILSFVADGADLGDFAHRASNLSVGLLDTGRALEMAVRDLVVARIAGAADGAATGITVYFPLLGSSYLPAYDSVAGMDSWRAFLRSYYGRAEMLLAPKLVDGSLTFGAPDDLGIRTLTAGIDPSTIDNVARVFVLSGAAGNGYCSLDAATTTGSEVQGVFSDTSITVYQGAKSSLLFADLRKFNYVDGAGDLNLPVIYRTSAQDSGMMVFFNVHVSGWVADGYSLFNVDAQGAAQLTPAPGSTLEPVLATVGQHVDVGTPTGVRLDATQPVTFELGYLPFGGKVEVNVFAQSSDGRSASIKAQFDH